jgi:hypothetical protein
METNCSTALDDLQRAVSLGTARGSIVAFQCTLAAARRAVGDALNRELELEQAAPSLAHRERLAGLRAELQAAAEELQAASTPQAHVLLESRRDVRSMLRRILGSRPAPGSVVAWSEALEAAVDALEEGAVRLESLACGQPVDAPARALAEAAAELLGHHHAQLQGHAARLHA